MELKQLRYFVRIVELGSISRAAAELGLVQSALSQQITRLEGELATRLLQRNPQGVAPTPAGLAFYREAQLTLRHAEQAARVAQQSRLSGTVTVGLAPSTAAVLGLPLMLAMHQRYPDVRLHLVESLSGHLLRMLQARQLDVAVLFDRATQAMQSASSGSVRWQAQALLQEDLFVIRKVNRPGPKGSTVRLSDLQHLGLILPTGSHGLRSTLDSAFARADVQPQVIMEIDSLAMLMDAVDAGLGATLQPWAAVARYPDAAERFVMQRIVDTDVRRTNVLCSLPDDELSPAALGTQVVLRDVMLKLVQNGQWQGVHQSG
jgi:LysR family transcriptional regulator, regulatory protein for tcuABC